MNIRILHKSFTDVVNVGLILLHATISNGVLAIASKSRTVTVRQVIDDEDARDRRTAPAAFCDLMSDRNSPIVETLSAVSLEAI
jgi:hypothetical protein